eukprot:jgi/Ulvmu1/266/UM001_0270.1
MRKPSSFAGLHFEGGWPRAWLAIPSVSTFSVSRPTGNCGACIWFPRSHLLAVSQNPRGRFHPGFDVMGLDYYSVLGLSRSAKDVDVKRSFRTLALKYHPAKDPSPGAVIEFSRVCEAYDVLSHPERKGFYDLHGEELLKNARTDPNGLVKGGIYTFTPHSCADIFSAFFGTTNPFEALEDISSVFQIMTSQKKLNEGKMQVHPVKLTLEEVYHGCLKKVTFQRRKLLLDETVETEDRQLAIDVKPGLPDGTRFVFEGEGNIVPGKSPGAVVFVLETLANDRFVRKGQDLLHRTTVPLSQALAGSAVAIKLLNGSVAKVPVDNIITPGYKVTVPNKGLPIPGSDKCGNLILEIGVLFPKALSEAQKMLLRAAFYLPDEQEGCDAMKAFQQAFEDPVKGWQSCVSAD